MKSLIAAIAITAAMPVAAQTTAPAHPDHDTASPPESGKGRCCSDGEAADKADADKKKMACCEQALGDTPASPQSQHHH